jgi:repressor LexA
MNTVSRIKQLAKEQGRSIAYLCQKMGVARVYFNDIEKHNREIPLEKLTIIADALRTTVAYLKGETEEKNPLPASNLTPLPQRGMRIIPVYETVSAGFGAQAEDHVIDYLPCFILSESEAEDSIGIKVKGDSMYPKIEDGDIIRVVKQNSVESGQLAVVLVDDEGFVKRVTYGHGFVELQSINPLYPPMRFEGTEAERVRVIGLVRQIIKNV